MVTAAALDISAIFCYDIIRLIGSEEQKIGRF